MPSTGPSQKQKLCRVWENRLSFQPTFQLRDPSVYTFPRLLDCNKLMGFRDDSLEITFTFTNNCTRQHSLYSFEFYFNHEGTHLKQKAQYNCTNAESVCRYLIGSFVVIRCQASFIFCHMLKAPIARESVI